MINNYKNDYMKISQDTTNEIWSVTLRRNYDTPADKKRAIEYEIRSALEKVLNVPSTLDGTESGLNFYGEDCKKILDNPYRNTININGVYDDD